MRTLTALVLSLTIAPVSATAKTYSAERYDSQISVRPDGVLDVTETVVFRTPRPNATPADC